MEIISCIYSINSKLFPNRFYIGSTNHFYRRRSFHIDRLRKNKHSARWMQNHYNKYGEGDLIFMIIIRCDVDLLIKTEQLFIDNYHPCFNTAPNARSSSGVKRSPEFIEKQRLANLGEKNPMFGKKASIETREKMSKARTGKVQSEETKRKRVETFKRLYAAGLIKKHKPHSPDTIKKIANFHRGRKRSAETCEKIRQKALGRRCSEEGRQKRKESMLEYHRRKRNGG